MSILLELSGHGSNDLGFNPKTSKPNTGKDLGLVDFRSYEVICWFVKYLIFYLNNPIHI